MGKAKIICVTSIFPASVSDIWNKIQRLDTLQYIAAPFVTFESLDNEHILWQEGASSQFQLKLFGIFPFGIHTINVLEFNRDSLSIYTNEQNNSVPTWNHRISLKELGVNSTQYSDQVEIYAGWKTIFVYWWSYLFYRHRQKKWLNLLGGATKSK